MGTGDKTKHSSSTGNFWELLEDQLESLGVSIEKGMGSLGTVLEDLEENLSENIKVVCITPDLGDSVRDMGSKPRDHTVMVRVDELTRQKLDAWVETGAVKSRSEAAALFIREGLHVRSQELSELKDALASVERAKQRLRSKAKTVFGDHRTEDGVDE
jgi:Arc/MetJ-type ribon-helix-helix transcriptional regulator